ncbi:hypothetical protein [Methylobacterium gregans]|uniref:hypothetical protein n=1 Tax=Methylobacterium gregans TaxID=374424 RepID=UPI001EE2BBD2|nr:hypothetical protein [Methylobacterium gregans]MDQ0523941.1 hypothetical protein [Methylobacterium gregans]GLS56092.1 hypothetical protein GCM10007886_42770 [Methylobacterium gregans]
MPEGDQPGVSGIRGRAWPSQSARAPDRGIGEPASPRDEALEDCDGSGEARTAAGSLGSGDRGQPSSEIGLGRGAVRPDAVMIGGGAKHPCAGSPHLRVDV